MHWIYPYALVSSLGLLVLVLSSCVASPEPTIREARLKIQRVLPDADLSGVEAEIWRSDSQAEARRVLATEALSYPFAREILAGRADVFSRLGLIAPGERPLDSLIGKNSSIPAFVVPSRNLILLRPQVVERVEVVSHELGHIASFRNGYWKRPAPFLWLHPRFQMDPKWVDLDAYIASWAMEEGTAEFTSLSAMSGDGDASVKQINRWWRPGALSPSFLGPLSIRITQLAYGDGPRYIAHLSSGPSGVRAKLDAAWNRFRGSTREIMDPRLAPRSSQLAGTVRERFDSLMPPPTSVTRIGSFLLFQSISRLDGFAVQPGATLARALLDDLFLAWDGGQQLWITVWPDEESGRRFVAEFRRVSPELELIRSGSTVVLGWNSPPTQALGVLLP